VKLRCIERESERLFCVNDAPTARPPARLPLFQGAAVKARKPRPVVYASVPRLLRSRTTEAEVEERRRRRERKIQGVRVSPCALRRDEIFDSP